MRRGTRGGRLDFLCSQTEGLRKKKCKGTSYGGGMRGLRESKNNRERVASLTGNEERRVLISGCHLLLTTREHAAHAFSRSARAL